MSNDWRKLADGDIVFIAYSLDTDTHSETYYKKARITVDDYKVKSNEYEIRLILDSSVEHFEDIDECVLIFKDEESENDKVTGVFCTETPFYIFKDENACQKFCAEENIKNAKRLDEKIELLKEKSAMLKSGMNFEQDIAFVEIS